MASIFTLENVSDFSEKLNIDELYEKKRQYDLNKLEVYNKILNRIHVRIKTTSKKQIEEQCCWFVVPEIIIGVPKYDQGTCIAYLMDKLKENGFLIKYIHPNTLFITWNHWIPSYVRTEFKKKTGIIVDEFGRKIGNNEESENLVIASRQDIEPADLNEAIFKTRDPAKISIKPQKNFTPIRSYKPSGNLIYNDDLLNTLEDKLNG